MKERTSNRKSQGEGVHVTVSRTVQEVRYEPFSISLTLDVPGAITREGITEALNMAEHIIDQRIDIRLEELERGER